MLAPGLGLKATKIRLEARSAEVHVDDVRIMSPAPHLNPELGETHVQTLVVGKRHPFRGARGDVVCASRADDGLIDPIEDQFKWTW